MTQEGKVVRCDGETAFVEVIRESACAHDCSKCGGLCGQQKPIVVPVVNRAGAKEGDFVRIESSTKTVLKQAFIVYMVPVLAFLGAYVVLHALSLSDKMAIGISCAVLALAIGCIMFYDKRVGLRGEKPVIIEIF